MITPSGIITYKMSQSLHKAVNRAVVVASRTDWDYDAGVVSLGSRNPYKQRRKVILWDHLAGSMYSIGYHVARAYACGDKHYG